MIQKLGRYKGSKREKQDRLDFQKEILKCLQIARRCAIRTPTLQPIVDEIATEYLAEKKRIEHDH